MIAAKVALLAVGMTIFADIIAPTKGTMERKGNHGRKKKLI